MTEEELKELASQLGKPNGKIGIEVADNMNENNIGMTISGINSLEISAGEKILELGHGNCKHLKIITDRANDIKYFGLEVSDLMKEEAIRLNAGLTDSKQAAFRIYDGETIPFPDNYFDKGFTVNTIYFWTQPAKLLSEIYRVIKPKGIFSVVFALDSFMEKLPFTKYGFELYSYEKFQEIVKTTPFRINEMQKHTESVKSKTGDLVEREYVVVKLGCEI